VPASCVPMWLEEHPELVVKHVPEVEETSVKTAHRHGSGTPPSRKTKNVGWVLDELRNHREEVDEAEFIDGMLLKWFLALNLSGRRPVVSSSAAEGLEGLSWTTSPGRRVPPPHLLVKQSRASVEPEDGAGKKAATTPASVR